MVSIRSTNYTYLLLKDFKAENPLLLPRNPCIVRYRISIMLVRKDGECFFKVSTSKIHAHIMHHDCAKLKNLYYSAHAQKSLCCKTPHLDYDA